MSKRSRRENIKKPSRYGTIESSEDNQDKSINTVNNKKQKITSVTDEINDIRNNISQYQNQELHYKQVLNNGSKCIQPVSATPTSTATLPITVTSTDSTSLVSSSAQSLNQYTPTILTSTSSSSLDPAKEPLESTLMINRSTSIISSPHFCQSFTSRPVLNSSLSLRGQSSVLPEHQSSEPRSQNVNEKYVTPTFSNTTVCTYSNTAALTSVPPEHQSSVPRSQNLNEKYVTSTFSNTTACTYSNTAALTSVLKISSADSQLLPESPTTFSSVATTTITCSTPHTTMIDRNRQTYPTKCHCEVNNNTKHGNCTESMEMSCLNANKSSSYGYLPASSESYLSFSSVDPVLQNNVTNREPHYNRESVSPVILPSNASSSSYESQTSSLTLLSTPETHNVAYDHARANTTYNQDYFNAMSHPNLNSGTYDMFNIFKNQITECMNNVVSEIRMITQNTSKKNINRRPVKPIILPFDTVEATIEFNQSSNAKYAEMVEYLASIGGRNIRDTIYLAFKEIFTTNVALSFTWTGKDNTNRVTKSKLSDLRIMDALYDAVSTHFEITISEFKYNVSEALRSAKQRHRHQQRQNNN